MPWCAFPCVFRRTPRCAIRSSWPPRPSSCERREVSVSVPRVVRPPTTHTSPNVVSPQACAPSPSSPAPQNLNHAVQKICQAVHCGTIKHQHAAKTPFSYPLRTSIFTNALSQIWALNLHHVHALRAVPFARVHPLRHACSPFQANPVACRVGRRSSAAAPRLIWPTRRLPAPAPRSLPRETMGMARPCAGRISSAHTSSNWRLTRPSSPLRCVALSPLHARAACRLCVMTSQLPRHASVSTTLIKRWNF